MSTRPATVNIKSRNLTDEENVAIFHALGYKCRTLATTVAELHCTAEGKNKKWEKQDTGVVCFVKDFVKRSFFFRFYDRKDQTMVWEQDIRKVQQFDFTLSDECMSLTVRDKKVLFLDKDEAEIFKKETQDVMARAKSRKVRRQVDRDTKGTVPTGGDNAEINRPVSKTSDKKKKKITKEDIVNPTNFRHVSHVGLDPSTGIDIKQLDPEMRALFQSIGISDASQIDKETLDFIYDFIGQFGGKEAVVARLKSESKNKSRVPPLPVRGSQAYPLPPPPNRNQTVPPPPPPGRNQTVPPPPPPSGRYQPPPPPPGRNQTVPPLPPPSGRYQPPPPPPGRNQTVPPPPPPSGRYQPPPPPPGRNQTVPPPPPPSGRYQPPPPPPARNQIVPPPPPGSENQQTPPHPPASGRKQDGPPPPALGGKQDGPSAPQQTAQDASSGAAGEDNPLKQQIMQLLLRNPAEITDFIYDIVDKRGGLDFITGRKSQTDPLQQDESATDSAGNQVPEKSSNNNQVPGESSDDGQVLGKRLSGDQVPGRSSTPDEVPGKRSSDNVSGATAQRTSDYELSSDIFDDEDGEWDDLNDQIDQY